MQVIFDTKILNQIDKEIDDFWENYTKVFGITSEGIDRTLGMNWTVKRIRELILEDEVYVVKKKEG